MQDPQGDTNRMAASDLGHAAAYEAYRTWMHSSYLYEPLSGDIERQREGLVGLAIAEGIYYHRGTTTPYLLIIYVSHPTFAVRSAKWTRSRRSL